MCFSATASFTAAGLLLGVGAASLAQTERKEERMFSAIPLLFGAQQLAEGNVWLTLSTAGESWRHATSVSLFLSFALMLWPAWVPLSLRRIERDPRRRTILGHLVKAGFVLSAIGAAILCTGRPQARVAAHSICYDYGLRIDRWSLAAYLLLYLIPTLAPFFVSTLVMAKSIGITMIVGLVAAFVVKQNAVTSVWCFFAALISVLIVRALHFAAPDPADRRTAWSPSGW